MPKITVGDLDINYKILGKGEPLLLIIGLSFSLLDWGTELPDLLAKHYQVILFDNRDAGKTSQATAAYTLADMATDAVGLLNALNIPKAHVLGISMGGMIAQQLALQYPDRLSRLILGCTMAGGTCSQSGSFGDGLGDGLSGSLLDLLFPSDFTQANKARLATFFETTTPYHSRGNALTRQLQAVHSHDTCNVLEQITAPTLLITGDSDRVIPSSNSLFLADKLPNAALEIINNAGHCFCFSHPDTTATAILDFLKP